MGDKLVVPARIVLEWDFGRYSVCKGAVLEMEANMKVPFVDMSNLNPELYANRQVFICPL